MKTAIAVIAFLLAISASAYAGYLVGGILDRAHIEATCNDENAVTRINGTNYICLPPAVWVALSKRLQQLGA